MKSVMIWGNLASDRTEEQYPIINVCEKCFKAMNVNNKTNPITSELDFDEYYGETCEYCQKNKSFEEEELLVFLK